ncbi:MAG: PIN domain-containing protein, partial [Burkholderiales bacterium]|nr:PIN domain-containing protein [Burkholderiales bacterium]
MEALIDTSVWVSGAANEPATAWARAMLDRCARAYISPIVLGELIAGVEVASDAAQRHRRRRVLEEARRAELLPLGLHTAEEFGFLVA